MMSRSTIPVDVTTPEEEDTVMVMEELGNTSSLEDLQTDEQRRILDMVVQVRKCGLDDNLSLPQLVVCGDQSAGKSSVLEALTEIPFPRSDNLCTRFATEISLRRANTESLTIKVNPDSSRPTSEQETIKKFEESITDFSQLPKIVDLAMAVMGIAKGSNGEAQARAFARDVLSIEISGPKRPQLTLVDIPGLIATSTKGVTKADVDTVTEITDYYISQPRTICLAVVSATNDYANQKILDKVRDVDPNGDRTLGIITKPDGLAHGSGSERAYIDLAQNEDIFFKLGWHVLKNRKFEETSFSIAERNLSEKAFFRKSNFKTLSAETVGIESLRRRLSLLLFEHIKRELPKLREDLEEQLETTKESLSQMGTRRSTAAECSAYLSQSSLDFHETCKAAINGHYEGRYFQKSIDSSFSTESVSTACRARAVVQSMNMEFAETMRLKGHKYQVDLSDDEDSSSVEDDSITSGSNQVKKSGPQVLSKGEALEWVEKAIERTRGKELIGSYNPLLIGELFWEQSSAWNKLALAHVESVARVCSRFLKQLLKDNYPKDVEARIWSFKIEEELKARNRKAIDELEKVINDLRNYPINYNHYYTDTITKRRLDRQKAAFEKSIKEASADGHDFSTRKAVTNIDMPRAMNIYSKRIDPDMNKFSCEEALDSLFAIYKVMQKTFIANVTTQVIERHIVHGLELIFSPVVVNSLEPAQAEALASEPKSSKRKREHLVEQIKKLEEGHEIFKSVM